MQYNYKKKSFIDAVFIKMYIRAKRIASVYIAYSICILWRNEYILMVAYRDSLSCLFSVKIVYIIYGLGGPLRLVSHPCEKFWWMGFMFSMSNSMCIVKPFMLLIHSYSPGCFIEIVESVRLQGQGRNSDAFGKKDWYKTTKNTDRHKPCVWILGWMLLSALSLKNGQTFGIRYF